jgi:hypothetical protein
MSIREFDSITAYLSVAPKRLQDAWELLEQPTWQTDAPDAAYRHLRTAIYLAGYVIECALKAYIISREPSLQRFFEVIEVRNARGERLDFSGSRGHSLLALRNATDLDARMDDDNEMKKLWHTWLKMNWGPHWRYHPKHFTERDEARRRIEASERIYEWIETQRKKEE